MIKVIISAKRMKGAKVGKNDFRAIPLNVLVAFASTNECWIGIKSGKGTTVAKVIKSKMSTQDFIDKFTEGTMKRWEGLATKKMCRSDALQLLRFVGKYPVGTYLELRKGGKLTVYKP